MGINSISVTPDVALKSKLIIAGAESELKRKKDFAVDAIVMSKPGQRNQPKSLLFGSTAEKVIRGSDRPVIVLPSE